MSPAPRIGSQFAGYQIESILGRGGMSVVYRAENTQLGNKVALKILAEPLEEDDAFRERFVRESRLAASINNAHVLPIYTAGSDQDVLYIAMKYVAGWDLRTVLLERGRLDIDTALGIAAQVGRALDAAHARDLVHRDVKPANILIERHGVNELGHVYLADFGLMKHTTSHSGVTRTGGFLGTVAYVAPEQIVDADIDGRADIYSLGCVLYETLTGRVPFERTSDWAMIQAHLAENPPPPSSIRTELPASLDAVVLRAMAKTPEERYQTCEELSAAARSATSSGGVEAVRDPAAERMPSNDPPPVAVPAPRAAPPSRPRAPLRWRRAAAVLAVAVLAVAGYFAVADRNGSGSTNPTPPMGMAGMLGVKALVPAFSSAGCTATATQIVCTRPPAVQANTSNPHAQATRVTLTSGSFYNVFNLAFPSRLKAARKADPELRAINGQGGVGTGRCGPDDQHWNHEDYWYHLPEHQDIQGTEGNTQADGQVFCYTDQNNNAVFVWYQCSQGLCEGAKPGIPFLGTIVARTKKDAFGYFFYIHHHIGMTMG